MKRRTYLGTILGAALTATAQETGRKPSIELNVDLDVEPSKEQEMLHHFHGEFHAAASKQPGFISAQMFKLRSALKGPNPPNNANYRFVLRFQSEEQRKAWVATPIHQKLWPRIEETLATKEYTVLLYDLS